jgi:hypothetical protein
MKNIENWDGLRVLTVREPWATLIVTGSKPVENRAHYFGHRGPLLIHASSSLTRAYYEASCQWILLHVPTHLRPAELPTFAECKKSCGKIIGGCELVDCERYNSSPWFDGRGWGLKLTGAWKAISAVPFKGQLSLGTYHAQKGDIHAQS